MATSRPREGAILWLARELATIDALFAQLEESEAPARRCALASAICRALTIQAHLEDRAFYPVIRDAVDDDEVLEWVHADHQTIRQFIAGLEGLTPENPFFDELLTVLSDVVKQHTHEEETEIFPRVQASPLDLEVLETLLIETKRRLEESIRFDATGSLRVAVPHFLGEEPSSTGWPLVIDSPDLGRR